MRVFEHKESGKTMFRLSRNDCLALGRFAKDQRWMQDEREIPLAHVAFSPDTAEVATCSGPSALLITDHTSSLAFRGKPSRWTHLLHAPTLAKIAGLCDRKHEVLIALTNAHLMHVGVVREGAEDFRSDPVDVKNFRSHPFPKVERLFADCASIEQRDPEARLSLVQAGKLGAVATAARVEVAEVSVFGPMFPTLVRIRGESQFDVWFAAARETKFGKPFKTS